MSGGVHGADAGQPQPIELVAQSGATIKADSGKITITLPDGASKTYIVKGSQTLTNQELIKHIAHLFQDTIQEAVRDGNLPRTIALTGKGDVQKEALLTQTQKYFHYHKEFGNIVAKAKEGKISEDTIYATMGSLFREIPQTERGILHALQDYTDKVIPPDAQPHPELLKTLQSALSSSPPSLSPSQPLPLQPQAQPQQQPPAVNAADLEAEKQQLRELEQAMGMGDQPQPQALPPDLLAAAPDPSALPPPSQPPSPHSSANLPPPAPPLQPHAQPQPLSAQPQQQPQVLADGSQQMGMGDQPQPQALSSGRPAAAPAGLPADQPLPVVALPAPPGQRSGLQTAIPFATDPQLKAHATRHQYDTVRAEIRPLVQSFSLWHIQEAARGVLRSKDLQPLLDNNPGTKQFLMGLKSGTEKKPGLFATAGEAERLMIEIVQKHRSGYETKLQALKQERDANAIASQQALAAISAQQALMPPSAAVQPVHVAPLIPGSPAAGSAAHIAALPPPSNALLSPDAQPFGQPSERL